VAIRYVAHALLIVLVTATIFASAADPSTISVMLFPETRGWRALASAPPLPAARLAALRSELASVYRASALGKQDFEGGGCSFIERALATDDSSAFRTIDVDEDGAQDIVYAGSAQCAEGDATVGSVWWSRALRDSPTLCISTEGASFRAPRCFDSQCGHGLLSRPDRPILSRHPQKPQAAGRGTHR